MSMVDELTISMEKWSSYEGRIIHPRIQIPRPHATLYTQIPRHRMSQYTNKDCVHKKSTNLCWNTFLMYTQTYHSRAYKSWPSRQRLLRPFCTAIFGILMNWQESRPALLVQFNRCSCKCFWTGNKNWIQKL